MIRFSKYILLYFFISGLVLVPGIFSLVRYGLRPSIDFTGGTVVEVQTAQAVDMTNLTQEIHALDNVPLERVSASGPQSFVFKLRPADSATVRSLVDVVAKAGGEVSVLRNETVGPVIGSELLRKALIAAGIAVVAILGYVAYAFKNFKFGICAVVALVHDLLVVLGLFSLFGVWYGVEVDTLFVTAVLTTMSFSVHDTIVIFDRIREHMRRGGRGTITEISDTALTETMNRSLTNSLTIIFMLLSLILFGGPTIRWFSVALLVGTISGTYSSPFVATPLLIMLDKRDRKKEG